MKERKVSIVGQRDTVLVNKELIFHLKNHLAKDLVIKDHIPKKHGPEKRRKESKLKHDLLRKSSVLNAACALEDTDKGARVHSHSKKQPQKQMSRMTNLGLHTRLKSYDFKDIVRLVALLAISTKHCRSHAVRAAEENSQSLMSLQQIRQVQRTAGSKEELLFDAGYFSSAASKNKYVRLPNNAKATLHLPSHQRTNDSLQQVHKLFLQMKLLSQYPHPMQIQLCKVGFYSNFSASRVIIRQGHRPFYFYIIISGSVMINEMQQSESTGEMYVTTRCVLEKGDQFGETALLLNQTRNATVVAQSDVELLVIDKKDFLPMFDAQVKDAQGAKNPQEMEHIQYLKCTQSLLSLKSADSGPEENYQLPREECEAFKRFPTHILYTNPMNCVVHYFRKGSVIVREMNTEWLYVVKSGTCRVVSAMPIEKQLKEQAKEVIDSLRKHGFDEIDVCDLEFNSLEQKEENSKIRCFLESPPTPAHSPCSRPRTCSKHTQESISEETSTSAKSASTPETKVCMFVCVRTLKPGDTFGFESLVGEMPDISLSVVSNNAECVVISKKLFQNFVPPDVLISLKARFQNFPYPTSHDITAALHAQWKWYSYKKQLLRNTLINNVALKV